MFVVKNEVLRKWNGSKVRLRIGLNSFWLRMMMWIIIDGRTVRNISKRRTRKHIGSNVASLEYMRNTSTSTFFPGNSKQVIAKGKINQCR